MSVIYSGQSIVNTTLDGSTNTTLNGALKDALISAGWSLIKDGTADGIWRVRSAATPAGYQGDLWLWNGGTNAQSLAAISSILATDKTSTSFQDSSQYILTCGSGFTFQLIATGYYFYLFRSNIPMGTLGSLFFTTPYQPANLSGLISSCVMGWGGVSSETIGTTGLFAMQGSWFSYLNGAGHSSSGAAYLYGTAGPTWFDSSSEYFEPRTMMSQTSGGGQQAGVLRACGYQWDALVVCQNMVRGTTIAYDGGSWMVLSESLAVSLLVKVA